MSIDFWPFRKNKGLIVVILSLRLLMIINELDETHLFQAWSRTLKHLAPTKGQQDIYCWNKNGNRNIVVKTFAAEQCIQEL